jgi:thiol peroxidase
METIYFKGSPCHTYGTLPSIGDKAPCFTLVDKDLKEIRCNDFKGKRVILNIFPSLDTPVCAASVRRFNQEAASLPNTVVVCVSMDLPFAQQRFCSLNGIDNLVVTSAFRSHMFYQKYGIQIVDGPLGGLLARAIIIFDENRQIIYSQLVHELTDEPDYTAALTAATAPVAPALAAV